MSGDSTGQTAFWNGRLGVLKQSFTHHTADVLQTAVNTDGDTVYTTGVDNKVVQFRLVDADRQGKRRKWTHSAKVRDHSHDIRALALSKDGETLITGGEAQCTYVMVRDSF